MRSFRHNLPKLVLLAAACTLLVLSAMPAQAAPPRGRHYAVTLMLIDPVTGEIDAAPACLSFSKGEMCTEFDDCGSWEFVKKNGHQNEWIGTITFVDDGTQVMAEIRGVTERLGKGNSIGGTMMATLDGAQLNAAFAGSKVDRASCLEFGLSDD